MEILLSICVPTYNRIKELTDIINSVLTINRQDIEIVITDNQSTDETQESVLAYNDSRIKYVRNEAPLPPFLNMIRSVFNAQGKYALYCNDRDLLIPERIESLLMFLDNNDFSFVYCTPFSSKNSERRQVFEEGYESLMNHESIHHPTGLVYNRKLMGEYLREGEYANYLDCINTYDFLRLDLFQYGKTAIYDIGCWKTRPASYIKKNKSGTTIYFFPEVRERMFYGIIDHVLLKNKYRLDDVQRTNVAKKIYRDFARLFCKYKLCMSDPDETAHYGLKTKFIPTCSLLGIYRKFWDRSIRRLKEKQYEPQIIDEMIASKLSLEREIVLYCVKIDLIGLVKFMRSCVRNLGARRGRF